jgi:hypothetical protein
VPLGAAGVWVDGVLAAAVGGVDWADAVVAVLIRPPAKPATSSTTAAGGAASGRAFDREMLGRCRIGSSWLSLVSRVSWWLLWIG